MGKPSDLVQGTLDLLILKTLSLQPLHGWAIGKRIHQVSGDVLHVRQGSLYPLLHRLEHQGWVRAKWMPSETGWQAKVYALTAARSSRENAPTGRGCRLPSISWPRSREAMGWLDRTRGRYRSLAHRGRELDELEAELRYHFDSQIAENEAAGMPPDEARRAARLTVGDPVLAVSGVLTMREFINQSTLDASFEALVVFSFAAVSLLLAAVGLFGVLSFVVSHRSKEIGIRFALGAQRPQMLRSMLLDGMRPAFVGVAFGLAGAWDQTADRDASLCDAAARSGRVRRRRDGAANRGGDGLRAAGLARLAA